MEKAVLLFATGNAAKLRQLIYVAGQLGASLRVISARARYGDAARYAEVGADAAEIAARGAQEVARRLGLAAAVEDTTFHVDALDGAPGVYAGRYLREHGRTGILKALDGCPDRRARIISAAARAEPHGEPQVWVHTVAGYVAEAERWQPGLPDWIAPTPDNPMGGGYNAIFVPDGLDRTLAEIPPAEAISLGYREPVFSALIRFVLQQAQGLSLA
ncbi:MAG: XTP/dITP diphosphatase [Anaerolineae bacterium]